MPGRRRNREHHRRPAIIYRSIRCQLPRSGRRRYAHTRRGGIVTLKHGKSSREYPDRPLVGVGGVVIDDGRALLIRRGSEPLLGEWSIPGGTLELGETLEEGV